MAEKRRYIRNESHDARRERLTVTLADSIDTTIPRSVTMRLCELSDALGCYQPKAEYFLQAFESKPQNSVYEIFHFRNLFLDSTCAKDVNLQTLQQQRYKIFVHLYRRLHILESDERKRQLYLSLCYKLFDVDKPDVLALQKDLKHREQFIDRLSALIKMVSHYFTDDSYKSDLKKLEDSLKTSPVFSIKKITYALRLSFGYLNCYVKGLRWQQEFSTITELPYTENEHVRPVTLVEKKVLTPWNGDDLFVIHDTIPQEYEYEYEKYLESYSKLMQCETKDFVVDYRGSPLAGNLWESREMILFLTDIIEQICREYEIQEFVIGDSQLVVNQGLQTESPPQLVDQVVQTSGGYMWLEELYDNQGKRIVMEQLSLDSRSSSTSSLLSMPSVVSMPIFRKAQELKECESREQESLLELEAEREPVVKELFGMNLQLPKDTALQKDPKLVLELESGLQPELKLDLEPGLELKLKPELEPELELKPKLEPELEWELKPQLEWELEPELKLKLELELELDLELNRELGSELQRELNRELDPELEPEQNPELDPELESELHPKPQLNAELALDMEQEATLVRDMQPVSKEQFQLPATLSPLGRFEHQRHIIVAPSAIIQSFKCNPAYQPGPHEVNPSDFYEQLAQFVETMSLHDIINVNNIRERLAAVIRWNIGCLGQSSEDCIKELSKFQLGQLLTRQELDSYQIMRWYHRDRDDNNAMTPQERRQDALNAMLGYECQQLMPSAQHLRLVLRSPHYQESLSKSYLLLALSQVGYFYRYLQLQRNKLVELGEQGEALVPNLISELFVLHQFYEQQQQAKESPTLFHLYAHTRSHQLRFQWLLQLCSSLTGAGNQLLWTLHWHLGTNGATCDELLQVWLLRATQPLLLRLAKWLTAGELMKSEKQEYDFFIAERVGGIERYWVAKFRLLVHRLPPFLNRQLAQLVLCIGRSHRYAQQFLGIQLKCGLSAEQLQWELSAACGEFYRERNEQPLVLLIMRLEQETSGELLDHVQVLRPIPLELLTKLHQYLLLSDSDFVRNLIELLLPLLEQPVHCYNAQQFNSLMEQLLGQHNSQLYVDQSDARQATHCWSRFLLRWKQPLHWTALLEHRLPQYAACFEALWQLHYVHYVLNERVLRQQSHFTERISLNHLGDAREVRLRFERFIDKLRGFIHTMRNYVLQNVLGAAFETLYMACKQTRTVDELLHMHSEYLHEIESGLFQTKQAHKSRFYLDKLYNIVLQLDAVQQKFLALCQLMVKYLCGVQDLDGSTKRLQEFRWSCQTTCDALEDLDIHFQSDLVNFLLSLYSMGGNQWVTLARKLDCDRFYASNFKQLRDVQTFWYQRKKKKHI